MENLVTIAEFAKICRTTIRTIRFYDQLDLIKPVKIDKWTKYRYYSPLQTRDFFRIRLLQNFNVPLENILKILSQKDASQFLLEKTHKIEAEIVEKQKELKFVEAVRKLLFEIADLKQITKIESIGPYYLFGTYIPNEAYHTITPHLIQLQNKADDLEIQYQDQQFTFYLDQEKYKPKDTKIEIAIVTKGKIPTPKIPNGYFVKKFPKTKVYATTYQGPFEFTTLIYEKLHQLQITEKLPVKFAPFDFDLNGLNPAVSKFERVTKICFPLL